ncbi:LysR family transcriptional regulator [Vibrio sp. J1-1]|uniref:LysR family transcriptional regulator n=1 Tax=Vibrio sp. J1-1 TaxID=2912251 RepID=UPI001F39E44E|nr:LysR family transcriptional regulator [Vibrio sp. J1-1]MBR9872726.1 LysR family transcriptional regulator [Vibrionaceae bacterium]MCF7480925.1 LysR family transcriptional regulator [Vibrio sp. J1-1]
MQVSLPALKAFESAARLGSFKAAAAELSISPTAVSHHINKLEQRLSVTLFVRTTRKVTLTELGKELAAATSQGFQTIETAIEKVAAKDKQINVATTSSFAALVLIPALQEFYTLYPASNVNITSGESIEANNFTLPIRLGEIDKQSNTDVIKLEQFNLFCTAHTAAQFSQTEQITIYTTDWKNSTLPSVPLQAWLELNGLQNKQINVRQFDQELFGIQQALLENAYVFCSRTLTQGYVKAGVLTEMNTQAINSQLCYYIANKEKHLSRHNFMFIEWLEKLLKEW